MSEHQRTITAGVPAENAFRYLSSVSNLPQFVPHLSELEEDEENHVHGWAGGKGGEQHEVSGFFRADPANLRLDWESDGTPGYSGWLEIAPEGPEQCRIAVHISMQSIAAEAAPPHPALAGDRIEHEMDDVVGIMRELLEQQTIMHA